MVNQEKEYLKATILDMREWNCSKVEKLLADDLAKIIKEERKRRKSK